MEKLEKPRERGTRSLCGAEGTSEAVSPLLSSDPPRLCDLPRWRARGSASGERSPGPARRRGGSHGAWARGARGLRRSALARLGRPRTPGSAEIGPPPRRPRVPAAGGSRSRAELSLRAGPGEGAAPTREVDRLRRSRTAPAAPAVGCRAELQPRAVRTWVPAPGPRVARRGAGPGRGRGGAWAGPGRGPGGGREGPRHLRGSAEFTCSQRRAWCRL